MPRPVKNTRRRELTYQKRQNQRDRWRKRYRGREYTFPVQDGETVEASYRRCLALWKQKKAEVDQDAIDNSPNRRAWQSLIRNVQTVLDQLAEEDTPANRQAWAFWSRQLAYYRREMESGLPCPVPLEEAAEPDARIVLGDDPDDYMADTKPPWERAAERTDDADRKVSAVAERFLKEKEAEARRGDITHRRFQQIEMKVNRFAEFLGRDKQIDCVTSPRLAEYRTALLDKVEAGEWKARTAKDVMRDAVQFVRWLVSMEIIRKPRILDSPSRLTITAEHNEIVVFETEELKALFKKANERTRLFFLLMLNTGMTQADVGKLTKAEVDWKKGRVERKRSKTRKHGNRVPTVNYPLWPETFRLLKKYKSDHSTLALTNERGRPLWDDEAATKNIDSVWRRLKDRMTNPPDKPMKAMRATAATLLAAQYPQFKDLFLGHAAATVADKHYARYPQDQFDEAVRWLRGQFRFIK